MKTKTNLYFLVIALLFVATSCKEGKKEKGDSDEIETKEDYIFSTLVSENGVIVFQKYYNGKTKDSLCDIQSLTKGIMSILIGIAIDKEYIKSEDEIIEKYFKSEFKDLKDKRKKISP